MCGDHVDVVIYYSVRGPVCVCRCRDGNVEAEWSIGGVCVCVCVHM